MLNLTATTHKLRLVTSSAANIDVVVSGGHVDRTDPSSTGQIFDAFTELATIASATTTDICAVPTDSAHRKNVKFISIRNKHASTACDVTVTHDLSATVRELLKCTLLAGEELVFDDGRWTHFDVFGGAYASALAVASQAEMEAATDTAKAVTPGLQKYNPAHPKAWATCGVTGNILEDFGVASLTDNGTGDVTVTFDTAFATANYCAQANVETTSTTLSVANARTAHIRFGGQSTSACRFECIDKTTTTNLVKDPTKWHFTFLGDLA